MPILGRLFTTSKQTSSQSDIVITVTPHINRVPDISPADHLARLSGSQQSGFTQSIEEVLYRAQAEEEQGRRLVSQQQLIITGTQPASQLAEAVSSQAQPAPLTPEKTVEANIFRLLTVSHVEGLATRQTEAGRPTEGAVPEKVNKP